MHTVMDLLNKTTAYFTKLQLPSARLDAQILLAHTLEFTRTELYTRFDRPMSTEEVDAFRALVERRAKAEPVAYILGEWEFWSLPFEVGAGVLVPRGDTERLVELAVEGTSDREAALRIADVGTGTSCVACAIATELKNSTVIAIDVSADALAIARKNIDALELTERVRLVRGDVLSPFDGRDACLDLIVSNPPYVTEAEYLGLDADVRDYEPQLALVSGADGLDIVRKLVVQASRLLVDDGRLLFEIGYMQGATASAVAERYFESVRVEQDYGKNDRVVVCSGPKR